MSFRRQDPAAVHEHLLCLASSPREWCAGVWLFSCANLHVLTKPQLPVEKVPEEDVPEEPLPVAQDSGGEVPACPVAGGCLVSAYMLSRPLAHRPRGVRI